MRSLLHLHRRIVFLICQTGIITIVEIYREHAWCRRAFHISYLPGLAMVKTGCGYWPSSSSN
ncbi:hypothetical protein [Photorhabdus sp. SF281]|uniref:hypothetical protein n=1 Tax=Photorhabdus sp. SF281 TaxID=3459527 RepID=UPI0040444873